MLSLQEHVTAFVYYNLSHHYKTIYAEKYRNLPEAAKVRTAEALLIKPKIQDNPFQRYKQEYRWDCVRP